MTFDEDEEKDETWDDEDLQKDPESYHSPAHVHKEDRNANKTESEGEVAGKYDGDFEVNAPATDCAALDNLERGAGLKMNYCREAEDVPDDDGRWPYSTTITSCHQFAGTCTF